MARASAARVARAILEVVDFVDLLWRRRLATLQSVDDAIEKMVATLDAAGALDDTCVTAGGGR